MTFVCGILEKMMNRKKTKNVPTRSQGDIHVNSFNNHQGSFLNLLAFKWHTDLFQLTYEQ